MSRPVECDHPDDYLCPGDCACPCKLCRDRSLAERRRPASGLQP